MSRTNIIRLLFGLLAIAFFATPVAARLLGVTAEQFENRRLADPPKLSQGWSAFQQTSRYLVDHMPLRAQAVRANTSIWTDILDTDPRYATDPTLDNDQALPFAGNIQQDNRGGDVGNNRDDEGDGRGVLEAPVDAVTGPEGWLFVGAELQYACRNEISNEQILARWVALVDAVRATGRKAVMFVAPQKASVYPEHLPKEYPFDHCVLAEKDRFWDVLTQRGHARGVIGLRDALLRLKPKEGDGLFDRTDMHWTTRGALELVRASLEAVGGGVELAPGEIIDRGLSTYQGDLDAVQGRQQQVAHRDYGIDRQPGAKRVPGRTLVVGDSFAENWIRLFRPYFERLRHVTLYNSADEIVDAIERADRVVVEANEVVFTTHAEDLGAARTILAELRGRLNP